MVMSQSITHWNHNCSSSNVKGAVVKKIFTLNKNIVHLIDEIFWHLGFKTETQAEKVRHFICTIQVISLMTLIALICIIRFISLIIMTLIALILII